MAEQKYPADIIETVAKAIYYAQGEGREPYESRSDVVIETYGRDAVAALDALDLTVTAEWAFRDVHGRVWMAVDPTPGTKRPEETFVRRRVLHAETPWVEVRDAD